MVYGQYLHQGRFRGLGADIVRKLCNSQCSGPSLSLLTP